MTSQQSPVLRLHNTLSGETEVFEPLEKDPEGKPGKVRMYVCGPTVYDDAHLGHARCYITWDVLYRFLKFLGYDVTYARNVTDVDDKILKRAAELGVSPHEIARKNYESFKEDMAALNILPPDKEPFATQHIPQMIEAIQALINQGAAYATPDGSVYYRVSSKADYGKLSRKPLDELKSGARVEVDEQKESPLDFALWKSVSAEEQSKPDHAYNSPWGMGRPGWHIECSAMNHAIFGDQIDIHAGGADLIFPHHENEIAQSESWTGQKPFARYWLHNGFVNVSGEKMSKSLGNFSTIKKVLERYDANTIRYFLLTNGYRMPVDFNEEALEAAKNWTTRTKKWLLKANELFGKQDLITNWEDMRKADSADENALFFMFSLSMLDDLNTAGALAHLNVLLNKMKFNLMNPGDINNEPIAINPQPFFQKTLSMLHLLGFNIGALISTSGEQLSSDKFQFLQTKLETRKQAKTSKDWVTSDAIRKELTEAGFEVMDNKDGTMAVAKDGIELIRV